MDWLSGILGLGGSLFASSQNQASAQASMEFQKQVLQNRNQWAVEDLKKAGLNPILAAGATNSSAPGAQATTENPVQAGVNSAVAMKQMKLAERQQANNDIVAKSTVDLNNANAVKALAQAEDYGFQKPVHEARVGALGSSAELNKEQVKYLGAQIQEIQAQMQRIESQLLTDEKERDALVAQVENSHSQADRNRAEAALARKEAEIVELRKKSVVLENEGKEISNTLQKHNVPEKAVRGKLWGGADKVLDTLLNYESGHGYIAPPRRSKRGVKK